MLPDDQLLASQKLPAAFRKPHRDYGDLDSDADLGGIAITDPTQGLTRQTWTCHIRADAVIAADESGDETILFSRPGIEEVALTFDQNMNPFVAFVQSGQAWFWWFDTIAQSQVFTQMTADVVSPRCTLDDKRQQSSGDNDIILAYLRNRNLYYRQQRDRYNTEYELAIDAGDYLYDVQMASNYRLAFVLSR